MQFNKHHDFDTDDVFYSWDETDVPVPPKDWRPMCFDDHSYADSEHCDGEHETNWMGYIQKEFRDGCVNCPFRKKEE